MKDLRARWVFTVGILYQRGEVRNSRVRRSVKEYLVETALRRLSEFHCGHVRC